MPSVSFSLAQTGEIAASRYWKNMLLTNQVLRMNLSLPSEYASQSIKRTNTQYKANITNTYTKNNLLKSQQKINKKLAGTRSKASSHIRNRIFFISNGLVKEKCAGDGPLILSARLILCCDRPPSQVHHKFTTTTEGIRFTIL